MKPDEILCFRCKHFYPAVDHNYNDKHGVTDIWIQEPCAYSCCLCIMCKDFKEYVEDKS